MSQQHKSYILNVYYLQLEDARRKAVVEVEHLVVSVHVSVTLLVQNHFLYVYTMLIVVVGSYVLSYSKNELHPTSSVCHKHA